MCAAVREQMCFPFGHHKNHTLCGIHFSGKDEGYQVACNLSCHIMKSQWQQYRDSEHSKQTNRQKETMEQWFLRLASDTLRRSGLFILVLVNLCVLYL